MALFSLPPSSPQSDLDLTSLLSPESGLAPGITLRRTLAPEWFIQSGVQLTWPHAGTDWAYMLPEITTLYVRLAYEIARREPLIIVAPDADEVRRLLSEKLPASVTKRIHYVSCPTNDTWARDHGALTVVSADGPELMDFRFDGWGGKFEATLDNAITRRLADTLLRGRLVDCNDFTLEGGSIETDGRGTLLTTAQCLLNPNRNPLLDQAHIEALLTERLGINHFLWLHHGALAGDDTDSHIDTLARLCPNDTIAYVRCSDPADPHYEELALMEKELQTFRTPEGAPYRLIALPHAAAVYDEETGERLPATYANYLVLNEAVLLPGYAQPDKDAAAAAALREAYPDREVVMIDCRALLRQHGSLHCATMQYPRGVVPEPKA